ncbi:MAG: cytochrome-c oxidase, cbb3-type subunit III [Steroidobacteraceae bacterium]
MPTEFWGGWIVMITVTTFFALLWFVIDVYRSGDEPHEQEVWDETLREGAKPAPIWWFWFTLALMIVSVIYVMLYPGLGTWRGAFGWSQGGHIAERFADYDARFGPERRRLLVQSLDALAAEPAAMQSAWRIFNGNCSSCHGENAAGQAGIFPDLTDAVWQWGGDEAQIIQTLRAGRQAAMPAWITVAGEQGVGQLADYVIALSRGQAGAAGVAEGAARFQQLCMACHGADGSGNPLLGAPALNDPIWIYGGDRATVIESITNGRNGVMPAFGSRLDDTQIRLLAAWLKTGARVP